MKTFLCLLTVAALAPAFSFDEPTLEEQAIEAAAIWLTLLDDENYTQAWLSAAKSLKTEISRKQLDDSLSSLRAPLGNLKLRELKTVEYTRSLPQGVEGEFVVIQYQGEYANSTVTETVITSRDVGGLWRVSAYFIK